MASTSTLLEGRTASCRHHQRRPVGACTPQLHRRIIGWHHGGQHDRRGSLLQPCRVTNTSDEIYRAKGIEPPDGSPQEDILVSEVEVHNPELGILENRISKFFLEEMFNDSGVDLEETAYWFHTPPGGWTSRPVARKAATEAPVEFPEPWHGDPDAAGRIRLTDLQEGTVITGTVTDCWLYHGIQVDFGAEYDGLVHIPQEVWMEPGVRETLLPGDTVQARVFKIRRPGLYRWPVQLQLEEPAQVAAMLPPPESYQAPIDHGWCMDQGWGLEEISEATGRKFEAALYMLPTDHEVEMEGMEMAYGYDDVDSSFGMQDPYQHYVVTTGQELIHDSLSSFGY